MPLINLFDYTIDTELTPEIISAYLQADTFAFDIETDASDYHWISGERGLAYPAEVIMISFYARGLNPLVLIAKVEGTETYTADVLDPVDFVYRNADSITVKKTKTVKGQEVADWVTTPLERPVISFSREELAFIELMFTRENYTAIAHNLPFDARIIFGKLRLGVPDSARLWDTQVIEIAGGWLKPEDNGERLQSGLFDLTAYMLDMPTRAFWGNMKAFRTKLLAAIQNTSEESYIPVKKKKSSEVETDSEPEKKFVPTRRDAVYYSAFDSIMAYELYTLQNIREWYTYPDEFKAMGFEDLSVLLNWETEYTKWCVESAAIGVCANVDYIREQRDLHHAEYERLIREMGLEPETEELTRKNHWLEQYLNEHVSPEQIGSITKEEEDLNDLFTGTGKRSFGKKALKFYINRFSEAGLGTLQQALANYEFVETCNEMLRHAEHDGRIHSLLSRLAITSRNVSSSPNMQNRDFKKSAGMFIADPGGCLMEFDYSNCENWMGACYGADDRFSYVCAQEDFHSAMIPVWGVGGHPNARHLSKTLNFGTSYGMGREKLAAAIDVTTEQAQRLLEEKDRQFAKVASAKKRATAFAEANGYAMLWTGRRVNITKWNGKYKGYTAWNSLAQGGVAELVVRAILNIRKFLRNGGFKTRIVTQIHDSLIVDVKIDEYYQVVPAIIEIMAETMPKKWRQRTNPEIRFLTDIDHANNSKKWGKVPGQDYPFDKMTYMNRWGEHQHGPDTWSEKDGYKAPVWINEFGWGSQAIEKEMGLEPSPAKEPQTPIIADLEPLQQAVDWKGLQLAINDVGSLFQLTEYNGRLLDFAGRMALHRELCHRGQPNEWVAYLDILERLSENVTRQLQPFLTNLNGKR